jgi:hypothetical protein
MAKLNQKELIEVGWNITQYCSLYRAAELVLLVWMARMVLLSDAQEVWRRSRYGRWVMIPAKESWFDVSFP